MHLECKLKFTQDKTIDDKLNKTLSQDRKIRYEKKPFNEHILTTTQTLS